MTFTWPVRLTLVDGPYLDGGSITLCFEDVNGRGFSLSLAVNDFVEIESAKIDGKRLERGSEDSKSMIAFLERWIREPRVDVKQNIFERLTRSIFGRHADAPEVEYIRNVEYVCRWMKANLTEA